MVLAAVFGLLAVTLPVLAHHSLTAVYDPTKNVLVKGTLTKVVWANPHIFLHVDVPENGKIEKYAFESSPPVALARAGVKKSDFKIGENVTITAMPAKDGSKIGRLNMIKYSDGHVTVFRVGTE
jgi:hypothetical protein